jgi:hypothetical protein
MMQFLFLFFIYISFQKLKLDYNVYYAHTSSYLYWNLILDEVYYMPATLRYKTQKWLIMYMNLCSMFRYANEHNNKKKKIAMKEDNKKIKRCFLLTLACCIQSCYVTVLETLWKEKLCQHKCWKTLDNAYCLQKWYILWGWS